MAIESKLTPGKFIKWTRREIPPPANAQGFETQAVLPMTIEESTGVLQKQSNIIGPAFNAEKVHRNFQWLAWFPGAISQVPRESGDVLTGPMSGCWVVIYIKDGKEYVGHIGTADLGSPQTKAAKKAWHDFASGAGPGNLIAGFNPARAFPTLPAQQKGDGTPEILGLVTKSKELYAVFTYKGDGPNRPYDIRRIADMKQVNTEDPGRLSKIFGEPPFQA
jgi:hypothetical protein